MISCIIMDRHYNSKYLMNKKDNIMGNSNWEKEAFFEDALHGPFGGGRGGGGGEGLVWPVRSYSCGFCTRQFRSAQALGGHMNVHRRDRARLIKQQDRINQDQDHDQEEEEEEEETAAAPTQLINVNCSSGGGGCEDDDDDQYHNGCRKRVKVRHDVIIPTLPFFVQPCSRISCDQTATTAVRVVSFIAQDHLDLELRLATP